jgi:hypothetical protein
MPPKIPKHSVKVANLPKSKVGKQKNLVYEITDQDGNNPYIGMTTGPVEDRIQEHKYEIDGKKGAGRKLIKHYQKADFNYARVRILAKGKNEKDLRKKEEKYIQKRKTIKKGLNSQS